MSHSSLSAQLASLHSKTGSTSRQHSDAVGRGIHHHSQVGHSVLNNNSVKHKPSVLYPDSRAAAIADVPFTTLRENAIASLHYLTVHCSPLFEVRTNGTTKIGHTWKTLFGPNSIKYERGLNSKDTNAKFDGLVKDALYLLSSAWGDSVHTMNMSTGSVIQLGANKPSSVLHTLEYLIQKYYVHVHNAEILLVAFLPYHETFLFDRILQLVDLAQFPQWAFLRPFSAARGPNGVPRTTIAKWAASTSDNGGGVAIVKRICDVAERNARIHSMERKLHMEEEDGNSDVDGQEVRRGISACISFAAATLAETFHIQYSTKGVVDEALLRTMVPVIFKAIEPVKSEKKMSRGKFHWSLGALCPEWRSFGRIMVSLLVEKCELSEELNYTLADAMVRGCNEAIKLVRRDEMVANGIEYDNSEKVEDYNLDDMSSSSKQAILDLAADAILSIMTITQSLGNNPKVEQKNGVRCFLPMVTNIRKIQAKQMIGCNLSIQIFRSMMRIPFLAATFGDLYTEKDIDVRPLLASICAISISNIECKEKTYQKQINLIHNLMEESSLQSAWIEKETSLVASVTSLLVESAVKCEPTNKKMKKVIHTSSSKILQTMKSIDSISCDVGITRAVTLVSSTKINKEKEVRLEELLRLSGHLSKAIEGKQTDKNQIGDGKESIDSGDNQLAHLLPPMMALEHPNITLRMQAITKLEADTGAGSDVDDIASALLRRYVSDDEATIAAKSLDVLQSFHSKGFLPSSFFDQPDVIEDIEFGLKRWTVLANQSSKDDNIDQCLCSSLSVAALAAKVAIHNENEDQMIEGEDAVENPVNVSVIALVQSISALVPQTLKAKNNSSNVDKKALESLLHAIGEDVGKSQEANEALKTICESIYFQNIVTTCIDNNSDQKESKQFLWFFIGIWNAIADTYEASKGLRSLVIDTVIHIVTAYKKDTNDKSSLLAREAASIRQSLKSCLSFETIELSIQLVMKLSSVSSNAVFEKISVLVIKTIVDHWRKESSLNSSLFVLLEALSRQTTSTTSIERLLHLVHELVSSSEKTDKEGFGFVLITMLSLCSHSELSIRRTALKLFNIVGKSPPDGDSKVKAISIFCSSKTSVEANILMDGANALPQLLRNLIQSSDDASSFLDFLLSSCRIMAQKGLDLMNASDASCGDGFCHAVSVLLSAMEAAGETNFPLSKRWKDVGKSLFNFFLKKWLRTDSLSSTTKSLLECVVGMIKGVTVDASSLGQGIVITSEVTGSGRRSRSYSVGMLEGVSLVNPYPSDMTKAVTDFLVMATKKEMNSYTLEFSEVMISLVLQSTSWVNGVFMKMGKSVRKDIAASILNLRSQKNVESAGLAIMGLKLNASDLLHLMNSKKSVGSSMDSVGLLALTVITECICQQSDDLINDNHASELISTLFQRLSSLSNKIVSDSNDGCDYTRCCVIQSLLPLTKNLKSGQNAIKNLSDHAKLLVALLRDSNESSDIRPLLSSKSKTLTLQLLTHLCALSPATVVGSLVPAMINAMTSDSDSANSNASETAMMAIIPTYCKHASSAKLSLMDLLNEFIDHCESDKSISWNQTLQLYTHLTRGLLSYAESNSFAMATILTVFLASKAFEKSKKSSKDDIDSDETPIAFTFELLQEVEVHDQIGCSLQMLNYINKLLSTLTGENDEHGDDVSNEIDDFFLVSTKEICSLALNGQQPSDAAQRESMPLMWLIVTMVNIVQNNIFSLPLVKRSIRKSSDKQAGVCLKIWQELTTLQSVLAHYKYKEISQSSEVNHGRTRFLATVGDGIGDILSIVQRMLPTPHFLASVSSLLSDPGTSVEIQKRAIQLLAERSAEMNMSSPEASLFIEMIPDLVDMTRTKSSKAKSKKNITDSPVLRQISFRAIDHVAKNLGLGAINEKTRRKRSGVFLPAFECVASFLRSESGSTRFNKISDDDMDESQSSFLMQSQVLSSAALCAATLITLLQARCLAQLQTLVKPVISILIDVNNCIRDNDKILIGGTNHQALKLVQLSVTRTLVAVAESIPQFFTPFIEALLATSCLPSINIRQDTSDEGIAVNEMAERLENAIATLCPVHQLIPTLSKVTRKCFNNENTDDCWREAISILKILKKTISKSSRSDLNPLAGKVLNALVQTYGHDCKEGRSQLLKEANETLLSLVMKLSESQLRPLYARLREWRGEFDPSDENENLACKRFAFWSLSAAICQKLRNIFLPCMSSVLGDIIKELDYIASCLCQSSSQTRGNKRQKTQDISMLLDVDKLSPLQPLLLCLESALKADAHEGGNWIRSEDGQRYRMVLEPLGKLLQATIPSDFYVVSDDENNQRKSTTTYEMLIEGVGTEEQGSVSQTLTALAAAAGNEQLWKPLNYSLLQACGNGKRAEVRKTGVKSLLNIIQTLGEEYMVLLPECLPVLSELLEDEDESIIALAKECIHQGEELLGESLEDSLR